MDNWGISSKLVWSGKISLFRLRQLLLRNVVPRIPSFYIRIKSRLKNLVTTVHLLQCKTNFFICLCFWGRHLCKLKNIDHGKPPLTSKKNFFWFVYTCLHLSRLVYKRLDLSSDSSTLVYIYLVTRLHLSTFVYTRLDLSSDSSLFLEQIPNLLFNSKIFWTSSNKFNIENNFWKLGYWRKQSC